MKWLPLIALVVGGIALVFRQEGQTLLGMEEGAFATLLISVTLIAFIGTSVLSGYRGGLGRLAKYLGIWAVIAIGIVGGYSYKSEMAGIAQRITSELMPPGEPLSVEPRQTGELAFRIRRRGDGHFVARVQIGSRSVSTLIDTGASTVVLKAPDAKAIGLDIERLSYTVPVQTANGLAYAAAVRLSRVSLGPIAVDGVDALVAKPGALKESLLGMNFLRRLKSYEFAGDFLTLRGS
jgi:aspartyl protease family protein